MPKANTAGFSGSVDSFYDPEFTVQISKNMQVPDKISVIEGADAGKGAPRTEESKVYMHVPERIIVAGGDEHIAAREPLPELRLESTITTEIPTETLATPPRVITLNEYEYPSIDEDQTFSKKMGNGGDCLTNQHGTSLGKHRAPEEELKFVSSEMKLLRKRIARLEIENQARNNREILLYSFGVVYFLLKGIMWLNRHI